jgi:SAM-dependent methyltransferase
MEGKNTADRLNHTGRLHHTIAFLFAIAGYNGLIFSEARKAARACNKPLLNVGCKRSYTKKSDVNFDLVPRNVPRFVQGDIQNMSMFGEKQFGAVYASHVLEHVADPEAALGELHRVAENVFVITPFPIFPWVWLHPGHRWIFWHTKKVCRVPGRLRAATRKITGGLFKLAPARVRYLLRFD